MTTYEREEFSHFSNDQLLDYIEQQNDQLNRFEARFRDVVRAYKGVLKEKEALETTLKALSVQHESLTDLEENQDGYTEYTEEKEEKTRSSVALPGAEEGKGEERKGETIDQQDKVVSDANSEQENEAVHTGDDVSHDSGGGEEGNVGGDATSRPDSVDMNRSSVSPYPTATPSHLATVSQLKQQLVTLTVAMATLTEEKSKMESNFQRDKKAVLAQQDLVTKQLQSDREVLRGELLQCHNQLKDVQESLVKEQQYRSQDERGHGEMLKELQALIAKERDGQATWRAKLQDRESELDRLRKQVSDDRTKEYEDHLKIMAVEVEQMRSRMALAEKKAREPSPLLIKLQTKMDAMKEEHLRSIAVEEKRANDAEERLRLHAEHEEAKVASLELKLSDISRTVGTYDKQRENDQAAIQKLKERISQLDSENTALTKAQVERQGVSNDVGSQVTALLDKVARMKALLKLATVKINEKATLPTNIEELSVSDYSELLSSQQSRKECEQELLQLKGEFDKYKTRAQSVLRNRGGKMDSDVSNEELKKLSNTNQELREDVSRLQSMLEEEEERHLVQTRRLREEMRGVHDKQKQQVVALESSHKRKLQEIYGQMSSTRERSLKLIAEKDVDIHRLRTEMGVVSQSSVPSTPLLQRSYSRTYSNGSQSSQQDLEGSGRYSWHPAATPSSTTGITTHTGITSTTTMATTTTELQESREHSEPAAGVESNDEVTSSSSLSRSSFHLPLKPLSLDSTSDAVREILDQSSPLPVHSVGVSVGMANNDLKLLHHTQERQRRKEELALARRKMFELEDTIRDIQEREQCQTEQTRFLKEEIRKLQRDRSRETENFEYLKNIIIHYMSADSAGREQLISPIAAVLHFSQKEVAMIKKSIASRRWLAAPTK